MPKQLSQKQSSPKKLGFMSCILVVIGSCIGAGIFFKNASILGNAWGSIVLTIICWLVAATGILCISLALVELISGCKGTSNLGIGYWVKTFNNRYLYKSCRNFMVYIYNPILIISIAYYFFQAIFTAFFPCFSFFVPWWLLALLALILITWCFFVSGLSTRAFNIQNWIVMCLKFIPLVFAILIGFIFIYFNHGIVDGNSAWINGNHTPANKLLSNFSPVLGVIASIPAIMFAFNGFYYPANMTSQMNEPKKLPKIMIIGIILVTIIYILISVSICLCSKSGDIQGLQSWLDEHKVGFLYSLMYVLISIGLLSVINGTTVGYVNIAQELIKSKEVVFNERFDKLSNKIHNKPLPGACYGFIFTFIFFIICTLIGCFFANSDGIPTPSGKFGGFDTNSTGLLSFVDLISNWDVMFVICFIGVAILGGMINRKTNKVKVTKNKMFLPTAIVSVTFVGISLLYMVVAQFVDLGIVAVANKNIWNMNAENSNQWNIDLITQILGIVMLLIYSGVAFIPSLISEKSIKQA